MTSNSTRVVDAESGYGGTNEIWAILDHCIAAVNSVGRRLLDVPCSERLNSPAAAVRGDFICGAPLDGR